MEIKWVGANEKRYEKGRSGTVVDRIVIHWIVGKLSAADATFLSVPKAGKEAAAHYGVGPNEIHQYVKDEDTAYHAGNYAFNKRSIGIEHEGGPDLPIDDKTYENSARLILKIATEHNIEIDRQHIYKHSEIKATQCPGTLDIDRLITLVRKLKGDPQMADTVSITSTKFQELVQKASNLDDIAKHFSFDPKDGSIGSKVIEKAEELSKIVNSVSEDNRVKQEQIDNLTTELTSAKNTITTLKAKPEKVVTKEVVVTVEPTTLGELFAVIKKYFSPKS